MASATRRRRGGMPGTLATVAVALAAAASGAAAADGDAVPSTGASLAIPASHARLGFERVRFPGGGPRVGLVGMSTLVDIDGVEGLAIGPALYGAISGGHGGFFSLGGELAWRRRLVGPFGVELGVYAGGGGGGGAPAGGGLMLRPHADLVWDLGSLALGVSLSRVHLSGGAVDSSQLGLVVNANSDFRFVPAQRLGETTLGGGRGGLGFDRVAFVAGAYRAPAGKTLVDGTPLPRTISTIGVRAEQAASGGNAFWGLEANRAARGAVGGYAEVLGNVGVEGEIVRDALTLGTRVGVGMAGGGGVSTGGGLLVKGAVYGIVRLGSDLGVAVEGGLARAPNGNFRAAHGSVALLWALDGPASAGPARPARTDFSAGAERYRLPRVDGSERAVEAVALKVDRYLTGNFYVTGKALAAAGGGASGYSSALLGAGWMQPLGTRLHAGVELLAGAGGGGGAAGGGALVEPRAFVGVQITPALALRAGAGRIWSSSGALDSNVFDLALTLRYGVAAGR